MPSVVTVYDTGLVRAVQTDGRQWNLRTARQVEAAAIIRAPKRTGRLSRSHGVEQNRNRLGQFQTGFSVYADAPYADYVHGGTRDYHSLPGRVMGPLPVVGQGISSATGSTPRFIRFRRGQAANPWLLEAAESVV
jgi:hypothetical protein